MSYSLTLCLSFPSAVVILDQILKIDKGATENIKGTEEN